MADAQAKFHKLVLQLSCKNMVAQRLSEYQLDNSHNDHHTHRNPPGLLMHTITGIEPLISSKYPLPTDNI